MANGFRIHIILIDSYYIHYFNHIKQTSKTLTMKKNFKTLTLLATIALMSSFTKKNVDQFIGTYGVCESDPSQIKLTINADHTFYYQDFSVSDKKIVSQGNWTIRGKKIVLKDNNSNTKFHNVWSIDKTGLIAKSRKGMTFYRLGKIEK